MADVISTGQVFPVTLGGTVTKGDLIGTAVGANSWFAADANLAAGPIPAMAIALASGVAADVIMATRSAVLQTTSLTAGTTSYLSGTAGGFTETAPTGVDDLVQPIGRSISTTLIEVNLRESEQEVWVPFGSLVEVTAAPTLNDTGSDFMGVGLLAAGDAIHASVRVPRNAMSLVAARLYWSGLVALDTNDTYTFDVSAAHAGDDCDVTTDGITAAALTASADSMASADVSAGFNAAAFFEPGKIWGIDVNKAAEGSGGDDPVMYGVALTFRCVGSSF